MHPQAGEAEVSMLVPGRRHITATLHWYRTWKRTDKGWWGVLPQHLPAWWMHPNVTAVDPDLCDIPKPTSVWEAMAVQTSAWKQAGVEAPVWYSIPRVLPHRGELLGTLSEEKRRCGKPNCRCAADPSAMHGPYTYRRYRDQSGRERRAYVRNGDVTAVQKGIDARISRVRRERHVRDAYMEGASPDSVPTTEDVMRGANIPVWPAWEAFARWLDASDEKRLSQFIQQDQKYSCLVSQEFKD